MERSVLSSRNAGTTEYTPRQWDSADSLPTLSQLQMLYEEAMREETAPEPEPVPAEESAAPAAAGSLPALSVDIPSLEQLRSLRELEAQPQGRRTQPAAAGHGASGRRASAPIVRRAPSQARQKPAANSVRVVAVPKTAPAKPKAVPPAPPEKESAASAPSELPSLEFLKILRERMNTAEREPAVPETSDTAPAREFVSERFPSGIPSLAQLKDLREETIREAEDQWEQIVPERTRPAPVMRQPQRPAAPVQQEQPAPVQRQTPPVQQAQPAPVQRQTPTAQQPPVERAQQAQPAAPAPAKPAAPAQQTPRRAADRPSRLYEIPTTEHLKTLLAEEKEYGNLAFHDSVQQVKQTISSEFHSAVEETPAPQQTPSPAPFAAEEPKPGTPEKVHFIPYEEFVPGKEFEDVSEFYGRKSKAAAAAREAARKLFAETEPQKGEPIYFSKFSKQSPPPEKQDEAAPAKRRKEKRARKKKQKNEDFSGSVLEELPSTQQLNKSKPKYGRSTDVKGKKKPSNKQLAMERRRLRYKHDLYRVLRSTIFTLITVSAIAVLIAVLLLPVLRIYGTSMTPTLNESDIVLSVKGGKFETGDVIAFYYNNKILVKRVIAQAGDWVDITKDGTVVINGEVLVEPYVKNKAFGECDIELPYQVPEDRVFVMGDYRDVSIDSRNTTIGPIAEEQIVGRIIYRIWPFADIGEVE